jgi:hypothetical protein
MLVGMKSKKKDNPFYVFPFADYLLFIMSLTGLSVLEGKVIVMDIKQAPVPRHAMLVYVFIYLCIPFYYRFSFEIFFHINNVLC